MNYIEDQPASQMPRREEVGEEFIGPAYPRHLPDEEQPHMLVQAEELRQFRRDEKLQREGRRRAPSRQRRRPMRKSKVKKSVVRRAKPKRVAKSRVVTVTTKVPMDKTQRIRKRKRLTISKKSKKNVMARRSYSRRRMSRGARTDYRNRIRYPTSQFGRIYARRGSDMTTQMFGQSAAVATPEQLSNRQDYGYTGRGLYGGRGLYQGRGAYWGKALGGIAGGALGSVFGPAGTAIGASAGSWLGDAGSNYLEKKYSGNGLYQGRPSNEVMAGSDQQSPQMVSIPDESGAVMISNREYVGDVFAPAAPGLFDLQAFPLNPGLEQTFPWLSQMAANYEEYEFMQLVFEFKSAIQDVNSTNGQVGTIIAATNYNASQPLFTDKPQMVSYYGAVTSKTTDGFIAGIECDPAKLSGSVGSYVRTNPVLSGEDLKSYDHGTFQLATHNIPTAMVNGTLGELYCVYTIKLRKPKFLTGRGLAITRALFVTSVDTNGTLPMGSSAALLLKGQQNNLNVRLIPNTNTFELTFPAYYAGNLEVRYAAEGSLLASVSTTTAVSGNVVKIADIYAGQIPTGGDSPSSEMLCFNGTSHLYVVHVKVSPATNATDNKLTFTTGLGAGATINQASLDVYEYNSSLNGITGAPVLINAAGVVVVP